MTKRFMLICVALLTLVCSCSKKGDSKADGLTDEVSKDEISKVIPDFESFEIVFTFNKERGYVTDVGIVAKTKDGGYAVFDNDADYSSIAPYVAFLDRVSSQIYKDKDDITELPTQEVVEAVDKYWQGEKSDIQNKPLFKIIDRKFYDHHPDSWLFDNNTYEYNRHSYKTSSTHIDYTGAEYPDGWITAKVTYPHWEHGYNYFFSDNTAVPEDILLFE